VAVASVVDMSNYKRENTIIITIESREGWIWRMNDNMDIKIIKKYEIIKKVGKGAYGQVWKCTNKRNK
jgi:serine/threonine protein kinase